MNNKYNVRLLPLAAKDLTEIHDYISDTLLNPSAAIKQIDAFKEAMENLRSMPKIGARVLDEELQDRDIRKYMVKNYIVFYIINESESSVVIIRILHGIRNYIDLI